ncbi:MAG TPA: hypothetical protein VKS01_05860 [Bryobacteraceae bacterium]|nr:hypothetical protein [Bryobacteraceae bacterium]
MRFVLLHYHILKNAGSTIEEILDQSFHERFQRFDTPDPEGQLTNDDVIGLVERNPSMKAFSSHQIYYPVPRARGISFFDICFLRDPIDRLRSTYDYFRQKPADGIATSDLANRRPLGEFTRYLIDNCPWTVNDVQVNLLANGMVNDTPRAQDYERAVTRMRESCFPGVVDRFEESLAAGRWTLRMVFPELVSGHLAVNVSSQGTLDDRVASYRDACDAATFAELLRLNAMDLALLECTRTEVRRRFETIREIRKRPPDFVPAAPGAFARLRGRAGMASRQPPLFDADFYLDKYADVRESGMNPWLHYELHGAAEGRKPHPLFDPAYYLAQCPDARAAAVNPLAHFLACDAATARNPHRLFDCDAYSKANPGGGNPLMRYLQAKPA